MADFSLKRIANVRLLLCLVYGVYGSPLRRGAGRSASHRVRDTPSPSAAATAILTDSIEALLLSSGQTSERFPATGYTRQGTQT